MDTSNRFPVKNQSSTAHGSDGFIGIDIRKLNDFGIGTYIRHLITGFKSHVGNYRFALYTNANPAHGFSVPTNGAFITATLNAWRRNPFQGKLNSSVPLRLFHAPHYIAPDPGDTPLILTVHDLIHLFPPQAPEKVQPIGSMQAQLFYGLKRRYHKLLAEKKLIPTIHRASAVIAVSDATSNDLMKKLNISANKIHRIHNCLDSSFLTMPSVESIHGFAEKHDIPPGEYFLYCGNDLYHKNLASLLEAWKQLVLEDPSTPLLVLSGPSHPKAANQSIRTSGLQNRVRLMPYLQVQELPLLYSGAMGFIFPSLAEGFGLPVIEAMACKVPVACSDLPVLKEVTGGAAVFFDPYNVSDIVRAVNRLISEKSLRSDLAARGMEIASGYKQESFIRDHLAVYDHVMKGK